MHMTTLKVVKPNAVILISNIPVKGNQVDMLVKNKILNLTLVIELFHREPE